MTKPPDAPKIKLTGWQAIVFMIPAMGLLATFYLCVAAVVISPLALIGWILYLLLT